MLWETILLAQREIRRNAMRSSLTILGVVVGVAAVITMVSLGEGATVKVTSDIAKLGSNMLNIYPGQGFHGPGGARASADPFDAADVAALKREITSLKAVAPTAASAAQGIYGNQNWSTTVLGSTNDYLIVRDWPLDVGRRFTQGEMQTGKAVCILGDTVWHGLFGSQNPLGSMIRLGKLSFKVIGILSPKGQSGFGTDQDDLVLVPLRAVQRRILGNTDIDRIYVSVREGVSTKKAKQDIEQLMRERRKITGGKEDDFQVRDMQEIVNTLTETTRVLTILLGSVAAVSLLVGGIGIMNIMLVSVTERTREIGIRMAIGALERNVLIQFLIEAVVLSSLGGVLGIILALGASAGLARIMQVAFVFNPGIVILAFFFSAAVGVIFGYFPARKAAQLDPIEALRHE